MQPVRMPCYCGSIRQASRVVTQFYDQALKPSGVKITQYGILRLLAAYPGLPTGEIASALVADSTTLTRTLKIIQENGWIGCEPGEDRRERRWSLTAEGKERLREATPLWKQAQKQFAERMRGLDLGVLADTVLAMTSQQAG
ncbi:MarR family winged helix-turn-helix transcriptional regulator [Noviherbaspirillum galbum]|uniref:MarR family transcriptional regulator n=1 Tax=Noviherbaspirillum galbum TaxID=2709383 RepID=A0A6B3ST04_9BURK|nr:MarR family transcriptional regulator [Noviherbaspirillum galbum]NEX60749.1 MarR family transcriptional regulator [Noviherbaspirillum galbum]